MDDGELVLPLGTHTATFRGSINTLPNRFVDLYAGTSIIDLNEQVSACMQSPRISLTLL